MIDYNAKEDKRAKAVKRAKAIVQATEWSGDNRVNMTTIITAGRVLLKYIEELEAEIVTWEAEHYNREVGEFLSEQDLT